MSSDLQPRAISAAQFIEAANCEPDTPARDLPKQTNERVMAAFEEFKNELRRRLGRSRQRIDTRNRRYISRELNLARNSVVGDASFVRRISDLRAIFLNDVSDPVDRALTEIRNLKLEGETLVRRLEALRERFRLNPQRESDSAGMPAPEVRADRLFRRVGLLGNQLYWGIPCEVAALPHVPLGPCSPSPWPSPVEGEGMRPRSPPRVWVPACAGKTG